MGTLEYTWSTMILPIYDDPTFFGNTMGNLSADENDAFGPQSSVGS